LAIGFELGGHQLMIMGNFKNGLKRLRREGKLMGSREKSKRSDPLETLSFSWLLKTRI
jgi:hypothetical protein